jgi:hypothetical protein
MFDIGDKVKITEAGMGMAFNGHEETVFVVFDIKRQEQGENHYEIQLSLDGVLFTNKYNKNINWFKGRRFALAENAIIKDAPPKCVDAEGKELKVGDLISIVARKVGQYRITKLDLIDGHWNVHLEYIQSKCVHQGSADPDDNDPPIKGFDKWFKSGSYPARHVYKVDPAFDGFIGFYYIRGGKDLMFCVGRSVANQKKMKLQIVGSLNGEDQSYIGDIIQESPDNLQYLDYADRSLNQISKNQLEGVYGKRVNNVAEDVPMDEEKLQKELAELLKPLIEKNNNKNTFFGTGPADFTVVNHHNNHLYSKCSFGEPCHYDLKKAGYKNLNARSRPYTVVQWLGRINALLQDECKEGALATAAWIVTGPWKKAFKPKQDISKGYVEVNVDRTGNEIGSALLAIRQLTEFAGQSITIAKLLKLGIDMPIAWLLSFRVSWNETKKCFTCGGLEDRGHTMLHSSSRMGEVLRFLKKGLPKEVVENRSYRNWQGYDNIYSVLDEEITSYGRANDKDSVKEWFRNHLKFEVTGAGFDKKTEAKPEHLLEVAAIIKARMGEIK